MPTTFYPNATIPTVGAAGAAWIAITASTDAIPIVVHTTTAHGYATGDCVEIVGHATNTNANGTFQITVVDATHYSLNGTTGNGVGAATGNSRTVTVDPSFTLPSDGDLVDAAGVNTFAEGEANALPWLYERCGRYRLADIYYVDNSGTAAQWANWGGTLGSTAISALNTPQQMSAGIFAGTFVDMGGFTYGNPPGLAPRDVLDIEITTGLVCTFGSNYSVPAYCAQMSIGLSENGGGFSPLNGGSFSVSPGGADYASGTLYASSFSMRTLFSPNAGRLSSFDVAVMAQLLNAGSGAPPTTVTITPSGFVSCKIHHYRQNG